MVKKIYVSPYAEIISFASEDIMTASQTGNRYKDDEDWGNWDPAGAGWDGV